MLGISLFAQQHLEESCFAVRIRAIQALDLTLTALRLPTPDKADQAERLVRLCVRVGDGYLRENPAGGSRWQSGNGACLWRRLHADRQSMPVPVGVGSSVKPLGL